MSPLPRRSATSDNWVDEIASAVETEMRAAIWFVVPQPSIPYDADTDTGGAQPPLGLFATPVRIQHLKSPTEGVAGGDWIKTRRFRIQFPLRNWRGLLPEGTVAKVIYGNRDVALEDITISELSAIGSSNAAVRTVEGISELSPTPDA